MNKKYICIKNLEQVPTNQYLNWMRKMTELPYLFIFVVPQSYYLILLEGKGTVDMFKLLIVFS